MGATCCLNSLSTSDCILFWQTIIIGVQTLCVAISAGLAIWLARTIQNRLTNRRVLKDYLIQEIKELRTEYRDFFKKIYTDDGIKGSETLSWLKLMQLKGDDLLKIANKRYRIDLKILNPYQIDLPEIITENEEFNAQFKSMYISFTENSRRKFNMFEQMNDHLFNEIIILINDAD